MKNSGFKKNNQLHLESLEDRLMMSSNTGDINYSNDQNSDSIHDAWIVRTNNNVSLSGFSDSWDVRSLGEGFFSVRASGVKNEVVEWANKSKLRIEPDSILTPTVVPNDSSYGRLWGLRNIGGLENVWNTTTGSRDVVIAVLDTGINYNHPDLIGNIWTNQRELPGDGIDNDRNGHVDDFRGYDFANGDSDPMDDNGHGTHVAGTIGAVGNNAMGVAGVNWRVSLMPVKFLSGSGSGSTSNAIAAINYVTRMRRDFGVNIVATNNSWGGGGFSTLLRDAIRVSGQAGVLFVAAAGNSAVNIDNTPHYPASYDDPSIISVAALNKNNLLANFSNYGSTNVDLAAPGEGIYSTSTGNSYASLSGTSMATPHVTGAVALLASAYPSANALQIRSALFDSASSFVGGVLSRGVLNVNGAFVRLGSILRSNPPRIPLIIPDVGDKISRAFVVGFGTRVSGFVGDGRLGKMDVDMYKIHLLRGQSIVIDVDARAIGSNLDSFLRVFNSSGIELARNDDYRGSYDSYLIFSAKASGNYYIGISGYLNSRYSAVSNLGTRVGSTGRYEVSFSSQNSKINSLVSERRAFSIFANYYISKTQRKNTKSINFAH